MRYFQAQDTFVAGLDGGGEVLVVKGEARPETDELVKRDQAGSGTLFRLLDEGSGPPPAPRAARKAAKSGG